MDKKQIKRIIAREGSVILGAIAFFIVHRFLLNNVFSCQEPHFFAICGQLESIDEFKLPVLFYPLYLIIRFLLWATRALKEEYKKNIRLFIFAIILLYLILIVFRGFWE